MNRLVIYTCATKGYTYALEAQARRVQAMLSCVRGELEVMVIVVSDNCAAACRAVALYRRLLPGAEVEHLADPLFKDGHENYKPAAQLVIAQMRTAATETARAWDADLCLSLDSDVLPPANALRCMMAALEFDAGYYGVAVCPYPSQGGGDFLCGRGTPENPILPDFHESEKDIPEELLKEREEARTAFQAAPGDVALQTRLREAEEEIRKLPPRANVFASNAVEWRRRGWFSAAYPAIGKGAIVPTDWCGFGCTLMGREALALCDWTGYTGGGTEDLYINWSRWHPAGIRIAALAHCPCDHIIRDPSDKTRYLHVAVSHEVGGEYVGHLRKHIRPWCGQSPGDTPAAPPPPSGQAAATPPP